jgi:hypothetical protein
LGKALVTHCSKVFLALCFHFSLLMRFLSLAAEP